MSGSHYIVGYISHQFVAVLYASQLTYQNFNQDPFSIFSSVFWVLISTYHLEKYELFITDKIVQHNFMSKYTIVIKLSKSV